MGVLWAASVSALAADEIPVIGMSSDGRESVRGIPRATYAQVIREAVTNTRDSVLPELACTKSQGGWRLHTVGVGIGISATIGLGPVFSVQAAPKIMMLFTRSHQPIFPVEQ